MPVYSICNSLLIVKNGIFSAHHNHHTCPLQPYCQQCLCPLSSNNNNSHIVNNGSFHFLDQSFTETKDWDQTAQLLVRDPQVWKLNKNGWTGHGMVYFSNATFQLAWTLSIYVWLVCSAKFPAEKNSGQFCKRTVQFLYENYVFFSDTRCLDAPFETKCFINLSCGYRNLTSDQGNKWPKPTAVIEKALLFKGRCISFFHVFTEISSSLWCGRQPNESSTSILRYISWCLIVDMIYWKKWVFSTNIEHVSANLIPLPLNQNSPIGGNSTYASACSKVVCLCVPASRFNHWTYLHQIWWGGVFGIILGRF